jgi:subtilisin family serine protease
MFMLNATKQKIELVPLETSVDRDRATRTLMVRVRGRSEHDPANAASLVTRASRAFFEIGQKPGKRASVAAEQPPKGPPPVAFRETKTGLLHLVYREVVIRFRPGTPQKKRQQILKKSGLKVRRKNPFVSDQVIVYHPNRRYPGDKLLDIANQCAQLEEVVFSTPNFVSQFVRQAAPSIRVEEWHLRNTGANGAKKGEDVNILEAWKTTMGKRSIVVAVLDDGVDVEHPNLRTRIWKNPNPRGPDRIGRDFFLPDNHPDHFNPRPKRFQFPFDQMRGNDIHGTCCAGVVTAAGKDGGSVGAAPKCRILPVKIFHADDLAADERVANAIRYAAQHADIISCSWSGGFSTDLQLALEDVGQGRDGRGVAVFCATGNEDSPVGFPASDQNAIAVGASTDEAKRASYSNFGPEVAFVAPSSDDGRQGIFTTDVSLPNRGFNIGRAGQGGVDGLYTNDFGGTSSATPLAAGIAALVLSVQPQLSRTALRDLLANNADKIGRGYGADGHSNQFGFGRLNAGKAIVAALSVT